MALNGIRIPVPLLTFHSNSDHIFIISEIQRDISRTSRFFIYHLHSTTPSAGSPSEYYYNVWYGKTRMVVYEMVKEVWEYVYLFQNSRWTWL